MPEEMPEEMPEDNSQETLSSNHSADKVDTFEKIPHQLTDNFNERLRNLIAQFGGDISELRTMLLDEIDNVQNETIGKLLFEGLESGVMPMHIFYFNPSAWNEVCGVKDYILQAKALKLLEEYTANMIDIATPPDTETLCIYDFGVGTGKKGEIIINEVTKKDGHHIEYHGVDASEDMLRMALTQTAKNLMRGTLELKDVDTSTRHASAWKDLIKFLRDHDLKYSTLSSEVLNVKLKRIFAKYLEDPENINLIKHLFARIVSLHKKNPGESNWISELNDDVNFPITMHAHPKLFQDFNQSEFAQKQGETTIICNLGSEICNRFPAKSLAMLSALLTEPDTTDEHPNGLIPLQDEKGIHANYTILGLQLGEIPRSQKHFRELRTQMRKAYNNPAFRTLTEEPFGQDHVTYTDPVSEKPLKFDDIGFIYVDYEEDKEHPGYYLATHRLYITEDVEIHDARDKSMTINGKQKATETFEKTVEALFKRRKELQGKRKEIMRKLNVKSKRDLLKIDPKVFFSKDFSNYGSGIKIAEDILGEPTGLHETLLYPSYKPSLEQIVELCHQEGLKVINVFVDDKTHPTYCKILTRKMTPEEQEAFLNGNIDSNIFFIPEIEFPNKSRIAVHKKSHATTILQARKKIDKRAKTSAQPPKHIPHRKTKP